MFNGILTPRQLEGLRLLLTPFPQQQFNATEDRRSAIASIGRLALTAFERTPKRNDAPGPDTARSNSATAIKTLSLAASTFSGSSARSVP